MTVAVSACDLTIGWSRDAILLEHASFVVERGEVFGLLGRSAAGKSTLMRALIGLERPIAGHVAIHVDPVGDAASGRPSFGVMFQQGALFGSMTIAENIELPLARWTRLPPSAIRAIARAKLRLVGLEAAENELPAALSGGMRKRAALARALALEPSLVFLDEPSSGLESDHVGRARSLDPHARARARSHDRHRHARARQHRLDRRPLHRARCRTRSIIAEGTPRQLHSNANPHVQHFFARMPENV